MRRGIFIIPYFGKLPYYFPLWMHTASHSKKFDFWIITNDDSIESVANNIKITHQSFNDFVEVVQSKFEFKIGLTTPRKLCDFKPTYGYIFEKEISKYDYWGFCDLDLIWGDLDHLVPLDKNYDKIYVHGHMTLLKNTIEINRLFMEPVIGYESYQTLLAAEDNKVFDEPSDGLNINLIAQNAGINSYFDYKIADINPFSYTFKIAEYDYSLPYKKGRPVIFPSKSKILFLWENGSLSKHELTKDGILKSTDVRYLHFQKRHLKIDNDILNTDRFIIIPNKVISFSGKISASLINELIKDKLIYPTYYKLKFNNLMKKLHAK